MTKKLKRYLSLISALVIICLFCIQTLVAYASDKVILTVPDCNVQLNEEFTVSVIVENPLNTAGGSLNIVYDNTVLELVATKKGSAFGKSQPNINNEYRDNTIRMNWMSSSPIVAGNLIEITFKAIRAGNYSIALEKVMLADVMVNTIDTEISIGEITVALPEAVVVEQAFITDSSGNVNTLSSTKHTASARLNNNTDTFHYVTLYLAEYDEYGRLIAVHTDSKRFDSKQTDTLSLDFTPDTATKNVKLLVWNDVGLKPLCKPVCAER